MLRGLLVASSTAFAMSLLATVVQPTAGSQLSTQQPTVDNLLAAEQVRALVTGGAAPLRVECDFVTCTQ
jgi:hypothetical protein